MSDPSTEMIISPDRKMVITFVVVVVTECNVPFGKSGSSLVVSYLCLSSNFFSLYMS